MLDGAADEMRQVDEQRERNQPDRSRQQYIGIGEAAQQVARFALLHDFAGVVDFARKRVQGDAAQAGGPLPYCIAAPRQVIDAVAIVPGSEEAFRIATIEKALHGRGPLGLLGSGVTQRLQTSPQRIVL